jgi:hypothetical protein
MLQRLASTSILAAFIVASLSLPAYATPGGGKGQSTFPMECDAEMVTLTIGGGIWSAAYVSETEERFIPELTRFQVVDPSSGEVVYEEVDRKGSSDHSLESVCVLTWEEDGSQLTFTVFGKKR